MSVFDVCLFVYKGADETAPLIGHYCRALANETLPTVVLPGSRAWVRMVLVPPPRLPLSGFQLRYRRSSLLTFSQPDIIYIDIILTV